MSVCMQDKECVYCSLVLTSSQQYPPQSVLASLNIHISYSKFGFSDLDGNKAAKRKCLARKARDKEMLVVPRVINFY